MATIGTNALTLLDHARRVDPNGQTAEIVEILNGTNQILSDMLWLEGNLPTGHRTTVRSGLPSVAWRKLNYGVQPSKSTTVQVDDTCGSLESYSEIDKDLAMLNGNTATFRLSESSSFLEAMSREMATTLFYGDTDTDPEKFLGLAPRYSSLSAANARNVINGTGSDAAHNASAWLLAWGPQTLHGVFPKGSMAGLSHQDLGEVTLEDETGGKYQGFRDHWQWKSGFCLRDWRYAVRIANLNTNATSSIMDDIDKLDKFMMKALNRMQNLTTGKLVWYMNRTVKEALDIQVNNRGNLGGLIWKDVGGVPVEHFRGIPIRMCDALTTTEAVVA